MKFLWITLLCILFITSIESKKKKSKSKNNNEIESSKKNEEQLESKNDGANSIDSTNIKAVDESKPNKKKLKRTPAESNNNAKYTNNAKKKEKNYAHKRETHQVPVNNQQSETSEQDYELPIEDSGSLKDKKKNFKNQKNSKSESKYSKYTEVNNKKFKQENCDDKSTKQINTSKKNYQNNQSNKSVQQETAQADEMCHESVSNSCEGEEATVIVDSTPRQQSCYKSNKNISINESDQNEEIFSEVT